MLKSLKTKRTNASNSYSFGMHTWTILSFQQIKCYGRKTLFFKYSAHKNMLYCTSWPIFKFLHLQEKQTRPRHKKTILTNRAERFLLWPNIIAHIIWTTSNHNTLWLHWTIDLLSFKSSARRQIIPSFKCLCFSKPNFFQNKKSRSTKE